MRPNVNDARSLTDFAVLYKWDLQITKFPTGIADISNALNLRCLSAELPKVTFENFKVGIRGHKVGQNGIATFSDTLTFTFVETVDMAVMDFISRWRTLTQNVEDNTALTKEGAELTMILTQLGSNNEPIFNYEVFGCILNDYDPTGAIWDGETSDAVKPSLTVNYDYFTDGKV